MHMASAWLALRVKLLYTAAFAQYIEAISRHERLGVPESLAPLCSGTHTHAQHVAQSEAAHGEQHDPAPL